MNYAWVDHYARKAKRLHSKCDEVFRSTDGELCSINTQGVYELANIIYPKKVPKLKDAPTTNDMQVLRCPKLSESQTSIYLGQ